MQKKQLRNSKENISKIQKTQQDKNIKKRCSKGENCQGDLQQENCLGGQIKGMMKNIGEGWKGIGDGGKKNDQGKEK